MPTVGTEGPDTIIGTDGSDYILGLGGDDHIIGLDGGDRMIGGDGADILEGGLGGDFYIVGNDRSDAIIDIGGIDQLRVTTGADLANYPDIEIIALLTDAGGRALFGNSLDNEVSDGGGSNLLDGREGDDDIHGGLGNDILVGGLGNDFMIGGGGADRFDFRGADEIGTGEGWRNRDLVFDFKASTDTLNLGAIDANAERSGNQAFRFAGLAEAFSGKAGELIYYHDISEDQFTQPLTIVAGDIDGDGAADFEIELRGTLTLHTTDFIL